MKKRKITMLIIFFCSLFVCLISIRLFWNMGAFVDEYNTTPSIVCGGEFWLLTDWLRLALSGITALVSGIELFRK